MHDHQPPYYVALWGLTAGHKHPRWIDDHPSLEEAVAAAQEFPNAMVMIRPPSLPNGAVLGKVLWKKDGEGYATHQ